jgi:predicted nucleic acid-binding protein
VGVTALLDTSVLVGIEQRRVGTTALPEQAAVCVLTLEELRLGVLRSPAAHVARRRETYRAAARLVVLPVDAAVAESCAEIRAEGRARGRRYQLADSLIGATARVHGLPLFTQDEGMVGMLGVDVRVV